MISRIGVQRDDAFLCLALKGRRIGETRRNVCLSGATCLGYRSLANLGTIMVEDHDGGWLSGKGHINSFHLHGTGQLLRVLGGGDGHAIRFNIRYLPDAAVGVEFQTTERELDGRTTHRRVLDQNKCLRIMRAATTQYGCWSIRIPPEDEFGEILGGRDGAQSPLLKSLARVHLTLLEFRLVAGQIGEDCSFMACLIRLISSDPLSCLSACRSFIRVVFHIAKVSVTLTLCCPQSVSLSTHTKNVSAGPRW